MEIIRKIKEVKNNQVLINLPKKFKSDRVEIIILPFDLSFLKKELKNINYKNEKVFWGSVSASSLDKIWNNKDDDVYEELL